MKGKKITLIAVLAVSLLAGGAAALDETQMQSSSSTVNVTEAVTNGTVTVNVDPGEIDAANQTGVIETSTDVYDVTIQHNGATATGSIDVANSSTTEIDVSSFSGDAYLYVPDPVTSVESDGVSLFSSGGGGIFSGGSSNALIAGLLAVGAFVFLRD